MTSIDPAGQVKWTSDQSRTSIPALPRSAEPVNRSAPCGTKRLASRLAPPRNSCCEWGFQNARARDSGVAKEAGRRDPEMVSGSVVYG